MCWWDVNLDSLTYYLKLILSRLSDLAHAARNGSIETQRMIASIFLELVFNTEIRAQLTTRNIPGLFVMYYKTCLMACCNWEMFEEILNFPLES